MANKLLNFIKYMKFRELFLMLFLTITPLVLVETVFEVKYQELKLSILKNTSYISNYTKNIGFNFIDKDCLPPLIDNIPNESTVIIGHAYGSHAASSKRGHVNMSPKILRLLSENKEAISTLILNGDVFHTPSAKRWTGIYNIYGDHFDIFVAPGNHDIGNIEDNANKDIFEQIVLKKQKQIMPFIIKRNGFNLVIADSKKNDELLYILSDLDLENKNLIVVQHHVGIMQLNKYSNAEGLAIKMFKIANLEEKLSHLEKVRFIYGDGGAYSNSPRIKCFEHQNIIHFINGIGDVKGDTVLVLSNGNIFMYKL